MPLRFPHHREIPRRYLVERVAPLVRSRPDLLGEIRWFGSHFRFVPIYGVAFEALELLEIAEAVHGIQTTWQKVMSPALVQQAARPDGKV